MRDPPAEVELSNRKHSLRSVCEHIPSASAGFFFAAFAVKPFFKLYSCQGEAPQACWVRSPGKHPSGLSIFGLKTVSTQAAFPSRVTANEGPLICDTILKYIGDESTTWGEVLHRQLNFA